MSLVDRFRSEKKCRHYGGDMVLQPKTIVTSSVCIVINLLCSLKVVVKIV